MPKYRSKPVIKEAIQWTGKNTEEVMNFTSNKAMINQESVLTISTLEGVMSAVEGDYIIKGLMGEFYPCKPDVFEKSYEEIE